jgi:hypothetical protein
VAITVEADAGCITMRMAGEMRLPDVRKAAQEVLSYATPPRDCIFVDVREVTKPLGVSESAVVAADISRLAAQGIRRVAVVTGGGIAHLISKVFASFATVVHLRVKVFLREDEARAWLARGSKS